MSTATVTSKGQITIPADVRQALHVKPGDRVEFVQIEPGRFEVVAATRPVTDQGSLEVTQQPSTRPDACGCLRPCRFSPLDSSA